MKVLRIFGLAVALLILGVFVWSLFLPSSYSVKRSILIKSSTENVYSQVVSFKKWERWSVWTKDQDSTIKSEYSVPDSGKGAFHKWTSQEMGKGTITMTETKYPFYVKLHLDMEHGKFVSDGKISFETQNEDVIVKWEETVELGWNPISKIFAYSMLDKMLGDDYEKSLARLKKVIEM